MLARPQMNFAGGTSDIVTCIRNPRNRRSAQSMVSMLRTPAWRFHCVVSVASQRKRGNQDGADTPALRAGGFRPCATYQGRPRPDNGGIAASGLR